MEVMGQRLVVQIKKEDPFDLWGEEREVLAAIYYHWSGYSTSALLETQKIIKCIQDTNSKDKDIILRLIHFVESQGGGIERGEGSTEWEYITDKYPHEKFKKDSISRNQGLISISPKGIDDSVQWSEGDIIINIDTQKVTDETFMGWYEDIDEVNKDRKEWSADDEEYEPLKEEDIMKISVNPDDLSYDDISILYDELCESKNGYVQYDNYFYELIE